MAESSRFHHSNVMTVTGDLEEQGYIVVRGLWTAGELDELDEELDVLGQHIVGPEFSAHHFDRFKKVLTPEKQSLLYDRLKYLPALSRLSGSRRVIALCRDLGMQLPSLMGCCNMRMDKPVDTKHLFDWHQDTLYLLGSVNAVTLWIPLGDVNLQSGTIEVIPGSHKKGLFPFQRISDKAIAPYVPFFQRDLRLEGEITETPNTIIAQRGDVVVFKQMLLHRSTPNHSQEIRWTVQIRVTDLGEADHRRQRFPTGDKTNIFFVEYPGYVPSRGGAAA